MKIVFNPKANKQFQKLPVVQKKKVVRKLRVLADDPWTGKLLEGEYKGLRSLKAWPYRIIYAVVGEELVIYSVAHRQGVYKN